MVVYDGLTLGEAQIRRRTDVDNTDTIRYEIELKRREDEGSAPMTMNPSEIVAGLKELCAQEGPRISTQRIVRWIETRGGFPSDFELIQFAKKMRARQYARMLMYLDEESGLKIKRLWSFRDRETGERYYMDILQLPEERRRRLVRQYAKFLEQLRTVRQALSDYFAGQHFFGFFLEDDDPAGELAAEFANANAAPPADDAFALK